MRIPQSLHRLGSRPLYDAVRAAYQAGVVIRHRLKQKRTISRKGKDDLTSDVDVTAEQEIFEALVDRQYSPREVLSEERCRQPPKGWSTGWVVDPFDASKGFLLGCLEYPSVMIARREQGVTTVAVIYFPFAGEWFYAVRGKGSYRGDVRLRLSNPCTSLDQAWIDINRYSDSSYDSPKVRKLDRVLRGRVRMLTCGVPHSGICCRLLEGKYQAVIHDNSPRSEPVKRGPWDIIPELLMIEEAGGFSCTLSGEAVDPFRAEPYLTAQSTALGEAILAALQHP